MHNTVDNLWIVNDSHHCTCMRMVDAVTVSSHNHECTSDYGHEGSFCCERQLAVCNCIPYQYCTREVSKIA